MRTKLAKASVYWHSLVLFVLAQCKNSSKCAKNGGLRDPPFPYNHLFCAAPELRDSLCAQWVRFVQAGSPAERIEPFREMLRLLDSVRYRPLNELRRTFFRWFEDCFHEDKIPGDWRYLLNNVSLPEVGDMYALQVREWEKQVAAKAVLQERREMEKKQRREMAKKQRDILRQIVRVKFGMSLPRWLSGGRTWTVCSV